MPNPPIVIGQTGKILSNERVDVWLDTVGGDDAKDGFTQANAKKTLAGLAALIDGVQFGRECKRFVINLRSNSANPIVLPDANTGVIDVQSSNVEDVVDSKPLVVVDGGTTLDEVLASTATTGSACGLSEIMTGLNDAKAMLNLHMGRGIGAGHAGGADATNVITAADATDFVTARALADQIDTNYAAHLANAVAHGPGATDVTNVLATDPVYDLKSLTEKFNDIKVKVNAHVVDVTGAPALHDAVGADLITAANATKATAIAGTSLTVAAAGWTVNAFRGYWCEFISGPLAGETYLIRGNSADTIWFNGEWTLDPGTGSNFRIVRPETVIDGSFGASFFNFGVQAKGLVMTWLQNFRTTNGVVLYSQCETVGSSINYSHIIMENQPFGIFPFAHWPQDAYLEISSALRDPTTTDCDLVVSPSRCGLSQNVAPVATNFINMAMLSIFDSVLPVLALNQCQGLWIQDSSFGSVDARYSRIGRPTHAGFARCFVGDPNVPSVYPGIVLENGYAWVTGGIFVNCSHAIELKKSGHAVIFGGMGDNTLTGVYCHAGSSIDQYRDYGVNGNCEITGNAGSVELSADGVTEVSKWANLDGLPISTPECCAGKWFDDAAAGGQPWWQNL